MYKKRLPLSVTQILQHLNTVEYFKYQSGIIIINSTTLSVACDANFSGGIFWNTSRRDVINTQLCSILHPNFRSGVNIERRCQNNGLWSSIDLTDCTMFRGSLPVVTVSFTVTTNSTQTVESDSILIINNVSVD